MSALVNYTTAEYEKQKEAARYAAALIVAGDRNEEIRGKVASALGMAITSASINSLRKRVDVQAALQVNDREALQAGIANRGRRIEILEQGIELLHNTFVITKDGKRQLRIGDGIKGADAVMAVKTMADLVKTANEILEPKSGPTTNVQVNNIGTKKGTSMAELVGTENVEEMLRGALAAIEESKKEEKDDGAIDADFTVVD